jgi:hypothetical protein
MFWFVVAGCVSLLGENLIYTFFVEVKLTR